MMRMFRIIQQIESLARSHYHALFTELDVVKLIARPVSYRKHYLFGVIWYILHVIYGVFGLEYESRGQIDSVTFTTSPYMFVYQMMPRATWPQLDVSVVVITANVVGCWLSLVLNTPIHSKFFIYKYDDKIDPIDLGKILSFYEKLQRFVVFGIISCGYLYVYTNVLILNAAYTINLVSLLFWIGNIMYFYYDAHALYGVPPQVILASRCIAIQQRTLLIRLTLLNEHLVQLQTCNVRRFYEVQHLWHEYMTIHQRLVCVCKCLNEYARFWSPYLTILFMSFIFIECYFSYVCLFIYTIPLLLKSIFALGVLGIVGVEFVLIDQCAKVVKLNKRISKQDRTFKLWYKNNRGFDQILARNLIKAETFQESHLLHCYSFRLFGNYRITSKSFHIIISYISVFFLYTIKSQCISN